MARAPRPPLFRLVRAIRPMDASTGPSHLMPSVPCAPSRLHLRVCACTVPPSPAERHPDLTARYPQPIGGAACRLCPSRSRSRSPSRSYTLQPSFFAPSTRLALGSAPFLPISSRSLPSPSYRLNASPPLCARLLCAAGTTCLPSLPSVDFFGSRQTLPPPPPPSFTVHFYKYLPVPRQLASGALAPVPEPGTWSRDPTSCPDFLFQPRPLLLPVVPPSASRLTSLPLQLRALPVIQSKPVRGPCRQNLEPIFWNSQSARLRPRPDSLPVALVCYADTVGPTHIRTCSTLSPGLVAFRSHERRPLQAAGFGRDVPREPLSLESRFT